MTPPPSLQVLYVEDDDDLRDVFCLMLSSNGFDVTAVPSAEEALEQLSKHTFAAMLTDYSLPRKNADWLLREAKSRGLLQQTRVVVLSAEQKPSGIEGYPHVQKPGDIDVVSGLLRTAARNRPSFARTAFVCWAGHSRAAMQSIQSRISSFGERHSGWGIPHQVYA